MKFKHLLILLAAAAIGWSSAYAVPAKPGVRTYTQSDGSTVSLRLVGDEWHHSLLTTDGLPVGEGTDGNYYYRTSLGLSAIQAHDASLRTEQEKSFISANSENMTMKALTADNKRLAARRVPKRVGNTQVPVTGTPKVPIILVQYSDIKFADNNTKAAFVSQYTSGSKSAFQYFCDQSNGVYQPQFDVYGPYTLSSNRATYGGNDSSGNDKGVGKMVYQAVNGMNSSIDFSQYDNDGDGVCDVVIVVYAGVGEAQGGDSNSVWPCQWSLADASNYESGVSAITADGVTVDKFAVFNELNGDSDSGTQMDGVGTFCHEFSHCLGLPDFYETTYSNGYFGMGDWSLMDSGCYNADGYNPIGYTAYEKNFMSWIDLVTPTAGTKYTLPVFNQKSASTDVALKIVSDASSDEYFIVENRQPQGWDADIYSTGGLLITHVTYNATAWNNNTVNNTSTQRMCPVPADNSLKMDYYSYYQAYVINTADEAGDLWPYGGANEFTDTSTPAAKLNSGGYLGKPITEITQNADGTVSFFYIKGSGPDFDTYTPQIASTPATNITSTSFTAHWTDQTAASNVESYTLKVYDANTPQVAELLTSDFTESIPWTTKSGYTTVDASYGFTRLGSGSNTGSVTSPAIDLTDYEGVTTVKVKARAYNTDSNVSMKVSLVNSSGTTLATQTFTLTSSVAEYTALFTGNASANNYVKIESVTNRKRVWLQEVTVYGGDATSANNAPRRAVVETGDATSRTITGITGTSYTVNNLTSGGSYKFKVKAIYVGGYESDWSDEGSVTLTGGSTTTPELIVDNETLSFGEVTVGQSATLNLGILGADLQGDVTLTIADDSGFFSYPSATISAAAAEEGATVAITYAPTAAGSHTATIGVASAGAETIYVSLSGTAVAAAPTHFTPVMAAADTALVTTEGFTAQWTDQTAANLVASYTLEVDGSGSIPGSATLLLDESFQVPANTTWTTGGSTYNETTAGYLRLGTGTATGTVTSPAVNLTASNGVATMVITAKYYNTDGSSMKVSLVDIDGTELASETVALTDEDADYTIVLTGNASANNYVQIASLANRKRVMLKNAKVYAGDASGAANAPRRATTFTGITAKSYPVTGLTAGTQYSYKVKAIYTDQTESDWSNVENVTTKSAPVATPVIVSEDWLTFDTIPVGTSQTLDLNILAENLQGDITLALTYNENDAYSLATTTVSAADAMSADGAYVAVTFTPTAAGVENGVITISSPGAESVTVSLTGGGIASELVVDFEYLNFGEVNVGESSDMSLGVLGSDLQGNVTLELLDPTGYFSISEQTLAAADVEEGVSVTVTYAPEMRGEHGATIVLRTLGADSVLVNLHGEGLMETAAPVLDPATNVTATSFTAHWVDDTDLAYVTSYTLVVADTASTPTVEPELLYNDFSGWTMIGYTTVADDDYIQFGSSTRPGGYMSPDIDLTDFDGKCTVKLTAKSYTGTTGTTDSGVKLIIKLLDTDEHELDADTVSLSVNDTDFTVLLQGNVSAENRVEIMSIGTRRRALVKNVEVYAGDATTAAAEARRRAIESGDANSRTITDITGSEYTVEDLAEGGTFNFKVKAYYIDGSESEWSNTEMVTLVSQPEYLYGDVNLDGDVNVVDLGIVVSTILGDIDLAAYGGRADINGDGVVDSLDISLLLYVIMSE